MSAVPSQLPLGGDVLFQFGPWLRASEVAPAGKSLMLRVAKPAIETHLEPALLAHGLSDDLAVVSGSSNHAALLVLRGEGAQRLEAMAGSMVRQAPWRERLDGSGRGFAYVELESYSGSSKALFNALTTVNLEPEHLYRPPVAAPEDAQSPVAVRALEMGGDLAPFLAPDAGDIVRVELDRLRAFAALETRSSPSTPSRTALGSRRRQGVVAKNQLE